MLAVGVLAAVVQVGIGVGWLFVLISAVAWGTTAVALDLWQGYLGETSFGHGAFVAVGAYTWTLLGVRGHIPPVPALVITVAVTAGFAAVIGLAVVQMSHFGSAILTFFFAYLVAVILDSSDFSTFTGGQGGLQVPPLDILGMQLSSGMNLFYAGLAFLFVTLVLARNLVGSGSGRALQLIRESPEAAVLLGVRIKRLKWATFTLTGAAAGLSGVILAELLLFVTPESFTATNSVILVAMIVVGGQRTIIGPLLGAVFYSSMPQFFQSQPFEQTLYSSLVFLAFLLLAPFGVVGLGRSALRLGRRVVTGRGMSSGVSAAPARVTPDVSQPADEAAPAATSIATSNVLAVEGTQRPIAIDVSGVTVRYAGVEALRNVTDSVRAADTHAIIGPNGAGKTTLINVITGIQPATEGEIRLFGERITSFHPHAIRARGVSRTFQNPSLIGNLSVLDNVRLGLYSSQRQAVGLDVLRGSRGRRREAAAELRCKVALQRVGLAESRWGLVADETTLAERKLIDLARALVPDPTVLLLDEPTAGLGEDEIGIVEKAILDLREKRDITIVVIAHHVAFIRRVADTVTVLDAGTVLARGLPEEVTRSEEVLEAFIGHSADEAPGRSARPARVAPRGPQADTGLDQELEHALVGAGERGASVTPHGGLRVEGLRVRYGLAQVIEDASFTVGRGEIVGLAGRNGAGKTTVLKALSGVVGRAAGELVLDGRPLPRRPDAVARAGLVHVPEGRGAIASLSVLENLRVGALAVGRSFDDEILEDALSRFPALRALLGRKAGLLSGGEQQMLVVARGLLARPSVLMIDELSLGLAPKATLAVLDAVASIAEDDGPGVLLVDQGIKTLASICHRLYVLKDGLTSELAVNATDSVLQLERVYF